jgi:uncharacterized protein (TIGR00106 family)
MVLLDFSIYPTDKGESVSQYVARALDIVDKSGLPYRLHAMGTEIEGEWEPVVKVLGDCFEALREDCNRITLIVKMDYRKGGGGRLTSKIESLEKRLERELKT